MSGDFARVSFNPDRHYTRVLLQQGRVLLEADFNEQSALHHHYLRMLIVDLAGRAWRAGAQAFDLTEPGGAGAGGGLPAFGIGAGRFYVEGLPCHNPAPCDYAHQPFGPLPDSELEAAANTNESVLVYLEAWERQVSPAQHPWLREPALGGADSAIRSQIVWQVRAATSTRARQRLHAVHDALALRGEDTDPADTAGEDLKNALAAAPPVAADMAKAGTAFLDALWLARPRLAALGHSETHEDPCAIAPSAHYRGRENQLYCVRVHRGGLAGGALGASFKWSRENGSPVLRIAPKGVVQNADSLVVTVESLGHDRRTGLQVDDWVEIDGDPFEFAETAPPLGKVRRIDVARRQVTLDLPPGGEHPSYAGCTVLRRWDQPADSDPGGVPIVETAEDDQWTPLERGVRIRFLPGGVYRSGDYWLIPARVATGDIEWPAGNDGRPRALGPHGPQRLAAPLGFGHPSGGWTFERCGNVLAPLAGP